MKKCERIEVEITGPVTLSELEIIHLALLTVNSRMKGKEGIDNMDLERQADNIIDKDWPEKCYTGRMFKRICTWIIILVRSANDILSNGQKLDQAQNKERG